MMFVIENFGIMIPIPSSSLLIDSRTPVHKQRNRQKLIKSGQTQVDFVHLVPAAAATRVYLMHLGHR